jgi:hypothetical protein
MKTKFNNTKTFLIKPFAFLMMVVLLISVKTSAQEKYKSSDV